MSGTKDCFPSPGSDQTNGKKSQNWYSITIRCSYASHAATSDVLPCLALCRLPNGAKAQGYGLVAYDVHEFDGWVDVVVPGESKPLLELKVGGG